MQHGSGNGGRSGVIVGVVLAITATLIAYVLQRPVDWALDRAFPGTNGTPTAVGTPPSGPATGTITDSRGPAAPVPAEWLDVRFDAAGTGVARDRAARLTTALRGRIRVDEADRKIAGVEGQVLAATNGVTGKSSMEYVLHLRRMDGTAVDCGSGSASFATEGALVDMISSRIVTSVRTFQGTGGRSC